MGQGVLRGDASLGVEVQQLFHQVDAFVAQGAGEPADLQAGPDREVFVPVLQTAHARPDVFAGSAEDAEDLEQLVHLRVSREQGSLGGHLCEDRADGPHVHGQGVGLASEEDLGRAVPESHHLVSEGADGGNEGPGQAEIGQLQPPITGDEDVLRFQVTMHHTANVAIFQSFEHLVCVGLDEGGRQGAIRGFEILLEILVDEFKHEVQATFTLNHVTQAIDKVQVDNIAGMQVQNGGVKNDQKLDNRY